MDIVVIGSKGHQEADCFDWLQPFPNVEEYDTLILDLTTLTQPILDKLVGAKPNQVRQLPKSILTLLSTSRNVYCLFVPEIRASPFKMPQGGMVHPMESNWDWLPIRPEIVLKQGSTIEHVVEPDLARYFETVQEWSFEIYAPSRVRILPKPIEEYESIAAIWVKSGTVPVWRILSTAVNKSHNSIAAKLLLPEGASGGLYLLPQPTRCSSGDGVSILIEILNGQKLGDKAPEWWGSLVVPGTEEIEREIQSKMKSVEGLEKEIAGLKEKKIEIESYKLLLAETDDALVKVVRRALRDLNLDTEPTPKGYPADLINKGKFAVEVTGIEDKITTKTPKFAQLMRFKEDESKGEKIMLVANTYRKIDPAKRKGLMDFSKEAAGLFSPMGVCAMTSLTLYTIWCDVKTGKLSAEKATSMFLNTAGVLQI